MGPLAFACGLFCLMPMVCVAAGYWLGRNQVKLRSPFAVGAAGTSEKIGYGSSGSVVRPAPRSPERVRGDQ